MLNDATELDRSSVFSDTHFLFSMDKISLLNLSKWSVLEKLFKKYAEVIALGYDKLQKLDAKWDGILLDSKVLFELDFKDIFTKLRPGSFLAVIDRGRYKQIEKYFKNHSFKDIRSYALFNSPEFPVEIVSLDNKNVLRFYFKNHRCPTMKPLISIIFKIMLNLGLTRYFVSSYLVLANTDST